MKLLLSIDNSEHSQLAIEDTARGLWPDGTEVLIATAVWSPFGFVGAKDSSSEAAKKLLTGAADIIGKHTSVTKVETKVLEGNPKTEIINLLADNKSTCW